MSEDQTFHRCLTPDCLRKAVGSDSYCCPICKHRRIQTDGPEDFSRTQPRAPLHSWQCDLDTEARGEFSPEEGEQRVSDLTEFLRDRLAEDEATVRQALHVPWWRRAFMWLRRSARRWKL